MRLMVCPHCGGPLPPVVAHTPFVTCAYCGATSNVADGTVQPRAEVTAGASPDAEQAAERRRQALAAFHQALETSSATAPISFARFEELCRQHLPVLGQTEAVARVAYNLAIDAETDLDESLRTRGGALARLTVAYIEAVAQLRTAPHHELNLPFLFATPQGPRHYRRTLDVATIQTLAEREPPAAPARGFWARLFG